MRAAVLLLILVNVALFGYARLDRAAQSEGARLAQQVQPERIRLLSAREVAALAPAKVAARPDLCMEWGPFADADRARAEADLDPRVPGRRVSHRPVAVDAGRPAVAPQSMIVVRDPPPGILADIKALQSRYAGTDIKVGPCAPAS